LLSNARFREPLWRLQLYEYYSQLLDQTSDAPAGPSLKTDARSDPLQITQLEEEDASPSVTKSTRTQKLSQESGAAKETDRELDRVPERAEEAEIDEQMLDQDPAAQAAEAAEQSPLHDVTEDAAEPTQLVQMSETGDVGEDDDEAKLRTHHTSIETLKGMIVQTKAAIKQQSQKLMIKNIAKEVVQQILKDQKAASTQKLADAEDDSRVEDEIAGLNDEIATVSSLSASDAAKHIAGEELKPQARTEELASDSDVENEIRKLNNEIATVSQLSPSDVARHIAGEYLKVAEPVTQTEKLARSGVNVDDQIKKLNDEIAAVSSMSATDVAKHIVGEELKPADTRGTAVSMMKSMIQQAKHELIEEGKPSASSLTADGARFQSLDEDSAEEYIHQAQPKASSVSADGARFQTLDEESSEEYITGASESSIDAHVHSPELPMLASKPDISRGQAQDDEETSSVPTQELDMLRPAAIPAQKEEDLEARAASNIVRMVEHQMLKSPKESTSMLAVASTNVSAPAPATVTVAAPAPVESTHWAATNISIEAGPIIPPPPPRTLIVHQQTAYPEDVLAKKVADLLSPSIGESLTKQLMAKVEQSLDADESKMQKTITSAAAEAAKEAVAMAKHEQQKVVTTVHHTPGASVVTTVRGPADLVPSPEEPAMPEISATKAESAPVEVLAQPVHIEDSPSSLLKQIEDIAVKKHEVDTALATKEETMLHSNSGRASIAAKLLSKRAKV